MQNLFAIMLRALMVLAVIAPTLGHTKENAPSSSRSGGKGLAVKKQASLSNSDDGYKPVSSTTKCRETLRGTLDCISRSTP